MALKATEVDSPSDPALLATRAAQVAERLRRRAPQLADPATATAAKYRDQLAQLLQQLADIGAIAHEERTHQLPTTAPQVWADQLVVLVAEVIATGEQPLQSTARNMVQQVDAVVSALGPRWGAS